LLRCIQVDNVLPGALATEVFYLLAAQGMRAGSDR
jgi:hypothetical protein